MYGPGVGIRGLGGWVIKVSEMKPGGQLDSLM